MKPAFHKAANFERIFKALDGGIKKVRRIVLLIRPQAPERCAQPTVSIIKGRFYNSRAAGAGRLKGFFQGQHGIEKVVDNPEIEHEVKFVVHLARQVVDAEGINEASPGIEHTPAKLVASRAAPVAAIFF